MLAYAGDGGVKPALDFFMLQFTTLQTRAQLLLSISALSLTITGFSGPKIAATGAFARLSMAVGIGFVLLSTVLILFGSLRIRWVTQFEGADTLTVLTDIIRYRDRKSRLFFVQLCLLVIGLSAYVASVIDFMLHGAS